MNPLTLIYTEFLWRPLFNLLVVFTNLMPGHFMWVSIILLTLAVRVLLLPFSLQQARHAQRQQTKMADVRTELKRIQELYKDDKQKQAQETMALYRRAGVNPASGCLLLLIQLPILIALYRVFLTPITSESFHYLYPFVAAPATVNLSFLGLELTQASLWLAIVAGVAQFIQVRYFSPTPTTPATASDTDESAKMMAAMQRNMAYVFPAMTVFISLRLPSALALYWIVSIALAILQQVILQRVLRLNSPPATV